MPNASALKHTACRSFKKIFMMRRILSPIFLSILLAHGVVSDCPRSFLEAAAKIYLVSQNTGERSSAFANTTFIQNNKTLSYESTLIPTPLKISHSKITSDTVACVAYVELISTSPPPGHVIGTQIHTDQYGTPVKVDSIVTSKGDWLFNATKSLEIVLKEDWHAFDDKEKDKNRTTRAQIRAAADAYLDLWGNPDAPVPWGTPCRRMEGSAYTGTGSKNDSCNVGIPREVGKPSVTNRQYVIDELYGSANVLCDFGVMRNGAPDSHEIRLDKGKLRYVHTMTVMTEDDGDEKILI